MKKFFIPFYFFLLFFFSYSEIIPVKYYSYREGLPSLQVWKIYKSKNGYMWFGTSAGLCRYNGNEMKTFATEDGLPNNVIFSICEDKNGRLWAGTEYGGGFFLGDRFKSLEGLQGKKINDIISDKNGTIWIATSEGLFYYQNNKLHKIKIQDENSFYSLFQSKSGEIWVGGSKRVFEISKDKIIDISKKFDLPHSTTYSISENNFGNILIGTTSGLYKLSENQNKYTKSKLFDNKNIGCIIFDKKREITWIAIWGYGLVKFKNKNNYKIYSENNGIIDPFITDLYIGDEGEIWFSTRFAGVGKIYSANDILFTKEDGIPDSIISIVEDGEGNIWTASINNGVSRINLNTGKIKHFTTKNGLLENHIKKIFIDTKGRVWILSPNGITIFSNGNFEKFTIKKEKFIEPGLIYQIKKGRYLIATHKGLLFFDGKIIKPIPIIGDISSIYILCIGEDNKGNILIGTRKGLFILDNSNRLRKVKIDKNLSSSYIMDIYKDSTGKTFISTSNGLYVQHEGTYIRFSTKNGLVGNYVKFVREDSSGKIWIVTTKGISILEKNIFKNYTLKDGLCSYSVNKIYEDLNKRMWIITSKGINLFKNGKLININKKYGFPDKNVIDVKEDRYGILYFFCSSYILKFDGFFFQYIDIDSIFKSRILYTTCWCLDSMKNIWIGTDGGVIKHRISPPYNNTFFPSTFIEKIIVNGKVRRIDKKSASVVIPETIKKISFFWRTNSFSNENKIIYNYMLENIDERWSNDTSKNFATYANLGPGLYKFRVISKVRYNIYGNIAFLDIKVKGISEKHKELAAITLLLSLLFGLIFFAYNNKKLRKKVLKLSKDLNQLTLRNEMILIKLTQTKKELNKFRKIDPVSNLYNFHHFLKTYRESFFNSEEKLFLLLINIENFTQINFKYSVHIANSLLKEVASEILKSKLTAARLSGDIFAIILKDKKDAVKIVEELEHNTYSNNIKLTFYGICLLTDKERFSTPEAAIGFAFRILKKRKRNKKEKIIFY